MAKRVSVEAERSLEDHSEYVHLAAAVAALRAEAAPLAEALAGRTIWMVNSTARGGGVSEMLPGMISHLRELGFAVEWAVIESADDEFFELTKRIHNMLHGHGNAAPGRSDRLLYEATNADNARWLLDNVAPDDILVVHDPQPMPLAGMLTESVPLTTIWRCHIGLDDENEATRAAWSFLEPYARAYDHAVFSAPEYVPPYFEGRSSVIYPALDPLTAKNRPLSLQATVEVLEQAGLLTGGAPRLLPPFAAPARRLQSDGRFGAAAEPDDLDLLRRPLVTQVSRWDRLKGFLPLMRGFAQLKRRARERGGDSIAADRLLRARLVLAGPDPDSIADDPEGREVLDELTAEYMSCPDYVQADIAVLALPMADPVENALIVNALQRASTIVVQNSIREGFGLTITEALWKGVPVLTNSAACGPRQQVRDRVDGRLITDPQDSALLADAIEAMLGSVEDLDAWGRAAQRHAQERFLIYAQLQHWLRLLGTVT